MLTTIRRLAALLAGSASLLLLGGCDTDYPTYPQDMQYPVRTEPLVTTQIAAIPPHLDRPGELPNILENLQDEKDRSAVLYPLNMKPDQKEKLEGILDDVFGTPAEPKVNAKNVKGIDDDTQEAVSATREAMRLDDETLAKGSQSYRVLCLHCHGLSGNGQGPTAAWVNPHPRDYRQGIFKFTSSSQPDKERRARREDLLKTIRLGVEGTSMPPFGLLPEDQLESLVSYVIHLSMRGQLEFNVMRDMLSPETQGEDLMERINGNLQAVAQSWKTAETSLIKPDAEMPDGDQMAESVRNGWRLFRDTSAAGCIGCHKDYGRQSLYFYDVWGTIGRPTDLTQGVYRGGRRPIDFYWRIHSGVNGAYMPAFSRLLKSRDIWDLVNFLRVLPYPEMRKQYGVDID